MAYLYHLKNRWPTDLWKDAQCHYSSEKYKLKPQWHITSHLSEWPSSMKEVLARMWRKGNPHALLVGKQTGEATMENSTEGPQKFKMKLPYDPMISILGIYLKKPKILIWKSLCTPIFIAALFITAKIRKRSKCPSTDKWIKKSWYIYTMEYYSTIKRNEILPRAIAWMDLESIMLSQISQRKTHTIWFHIHVKYKEQFK